MKRAQLVPIAAACFALLAMGADSCSTETTDEKDTAATTTEAKETPKAKKARVGDSITLEGATDGEKVKATVKKILDPAKAGEFDTPEAGKRLVGIQVSLLNVGTATYDDSPSNGAALITTKDEQAEGIIVSGGDCGGNFASSVKLSPGSRQQGCIPFMVKEGSKLRTFQFGLNSGFGPRTGEWALR